MGKITACRGVAAAAAAFTLLLSSCSFGPGGSKEIEAVNGQSCNINAVVMTADDSESITYDQLQNGIAANINVTREKKQISLDNCDILYLDENASEAEGFDSQAIEDYVYNGGAVVLDNTLVPFFSNEFLGASEVVHIDGCPAFMEYPEISSDLRNISELLYDYTSAFKGYTNYFEYEKYDYGYGIIPSTAQTIGEYNGAAVYSMNNYGSGYVFLTNPMLPGKYTVSMLSEGERGEPFAYTTVGAENILRSYFAEYVSIKKFGFAVERSFGSFGTRPAAWELHYEDITGVNNDALEQFSNMCMSEGQMPSYTIARNFYTWFKRAESINYLISDGSGSYKNDVYENAYCSGTHVVSGGKWLELDSYEKTDSYFNDNKEYTKRAYPCPVDWNGDGNIDFLCGSADGKFYMYFGSGMKDNYETGVATMLTDSAGNAISVGSYSSPALYDINGDGVDELLSGSEDGVVRAWRPLRNEENPDSMVFEAMGEVISTGLTDCMIDVGDLNSDGTADLAVGSRNGEMRVYTGSTEDGRSTMFNGDYITVNTGQTWVSPCIYNGELFSGTLEGYVAHYEYNGTDFNLDNYLTCGDISRRGDNRVTIGMNSVPRFADVDGDGNDDLICGTLEYGMAYPIDSPYFPYKDKLQEQLKFCDKYNIYMGVHSFTHKYATPEHEARELEYHRNALKAYGLTLEGIGANQHTWFTSKYGYDGSGINGFNPNYNGSFAAQAEAGLLWNSGATMPESDAIPQSSAEDAIPMPMYMTGYDFLLLETSNTPHGEGAYSYTSVKYDMPMLFYNHCDYIYEASEEQVAAVKKVGQLVDDYDYMFVGENQMAKAVAAAYNTDVEAVRNDNGDIVISGSVRDTERGLYDEKFSDCVGVKVVFGENDSTENYSIDADVWNEENGHIYVALNKSVVLKKSDTLSGINVKQINVPAKVKIKGNSATIEFEESGLMCVRVAGEATTTSPDWTTRTDTNGDTLFMKFSKAQKLEIQVQ
ncbi:MAG: FG-GAP repeat domain-containing protein [Candidatus Ornithomonoglobus sp.]